MKICLALLIDCFEPYNTYGRLGFNYAFPFVGNKKTTDDSKVFITEMTDDKSIETVHLSNKVNT